MSKNARMHISVGWRVRFVSGCKFKMHMRPQPRAHKGVWLEVAEAARQIAPPIEGARFEALTNLARWPAMTRAKNLQAAIRPRLADHAMLVLNHFNTFKKMTVILRARGCWICLPCDCFADHW